MTIRHVILDRDGVLNQESPQSDYIRDVSGFHWLPGALEGLVTLRKAQVRVSVATNQSGLGRGLMSESALEAIHRRMRDEALAAGAQIDDIVCCTHAPEAHCECRKPAPGLIRAAMARSGIEAHDTIALGDARRDLEAGWRSGVRVALVRTGKGTETEQQVRGLGVHIYDDLQTFAQSVTTGATPQNERALVDARRIFAEHQTVLTETSERLTPTLHDVIALLYCTVQSGHKIFACGNGGSAADAQHFVAELVGRFSAPRHPLPAILLGGDTASLTAIANDFGFDQVFSRPLQALAVRGDILFAFSTSGQSANVLQAAVSARQAGCTVIAVTGGDGGKLATLADRVLCVPSTVVARIQEIHTLIIHTLCEALDRLLQQGSP